MEHNWSDKTSYHEPNQKKKTYIYIYIISQLWILRFAKSNGYYKYLFIFFFKRVLTYDVRSR